MSKDFPRFITELTPRFTAVIDAEFSEEDYIAIDLSAENSALSLVDITSASSFGGFINEYLRRSGKKVAYGGYKEIRKLYQRSGLFSEPGEKDLERNVHIGMDFWADAGTAVLAALDGKIHSFKDNASFGDYGPTIILEHEYHEHTFYTLYGHLSRKSLENLKYGDEVKSGQKIGALGTAEENGDYAPHLHFQVIEDLQEQAGDFPGVTSVNELDFYLRNCPDPNLLLKIRRVEG
ncbi:peptidoglycan DD-metalloendopeptidase family protein [Salegentibacter chungangensis]|uniref:Peptidoglycan DD-metalloendopeptidase family protein n=1 Tax=Salegentibacter chungangensis TaxID=1335724 RepID=A0ABW3NNC5_9FLAO